MPTRIPSIFCHLAAAGKSQFDPGACLRVEKPPAAEPCGHLRAVPLRGCGRMAAGSAPGRGGPVRGRTSRRGLSLRGTPPAQTGGGPSRKTEPAQARNSHGQLHIYALAAWFRVLGFGEAQARLFGLVCLFLHGWVVLCLLRLFLGKEVQKNNGPVVLGPVSAEPLHAARRCGSRHRHDCLRPAVGRPGGSSASYQLVGRPAAPGGLADDPGTLPDRIGENARLLSRSGPPPSLSSRWFSCCWPEAKDGAMR
jgi:hypothetical protein